MRRRKFDWSRANNSIKESSRDIWDWRALESRRRLQEESWNDERMTSFRDAAQ